MKIFKARQMYLLFIVILSVFSITGCGGGGSDGQAPILGSGDATIAPTVTAVAPLNRATGVPVNIKLITAAFSKAMAPATLTTTSFTLVPDGGTVVTNTGVTYVTTGNVATLTLPAGDLLPNKRYTATITTAATDTAGAPLAENYVWTFTTGATADITAPFVIATGAYGITGDTSGGTFPVNRVSTATFNEAMNPLTITTPPSFTVVNDTLVPPAAVAGTVTYSVAGKTATFTPTGGTFAANSDFTSTVTFASKDLAGNAMLASYIWTWSTSNALDTTAPTVTNTNPLNAATGVCENKTVSATFSEEIDQNTLTNLTFTVTGKTGVLTYDATTHIASFNPLTDFAPGTYTATIKGGASGVKDLAGNPLAVDKVWSFTTDTSTCAAPPDLASATTFAIAATTGMTTAGGLSYPVINGDVTLHATSTCNGVPVLADGTIGPCNGSPPTVSGTVYSSFYLPAVAIAVKGDLRETYLDISPARLPGGTPIAAPTTLGTGSTGQSTFTPGVYTSDTSIMITGDLTLDAQGDSNAVFVFQSSSTIGSAVGGTRILLTGGAKASNVWWQAGSAATLQTSTIWNGNILAYDNITMNAGAISCGRLFAGASTDGFLSLLINTVISVPGNDPVRPLCQ